VGAKPGTLRALGTPATIEVLPDVPTPAEIKPADFEINACFGAFVPFAPATAGKSPGGPL
jgi:hypothetical protein